MRNYNYQNKWQKLLTPENVSLLTQIHEYKGEQTLFVEAKADTLTQLVEIAKIQSTEASNKIEGIYTSDERLKSLVTNKAIPHTRNEQEIAGYRDVLSIIHESFDAISLSRNYILQLHKIMYSHMNNPMAGRTKSVQNYISATYPDGHVEIIFTPLAPFETREAFDRICEEYNRVIGNLEVEPLIAIPIFIHDFLCIEIHNRTVTFYNLFNHTNPSFIYRFSLISCV